MKDQVTSIEQSTRLIELGVPAGEASMVWEWVCGAVDEINYELKIWQGCKLDKIFDYQEFPESFIPAFTVADLLGLLPPKISCQDPSDGNFRMRRYMGENGVEWVIDYDCFVANDVCIINALVKAITLLVSTKHELNL
ncbi:hypothetical protein [Alistipes sp.]|uniref:hypothetical protein n=1 Tax=Alistipes sp. TaxID=1872444 RepID=UPI003AB1E36E